MAPMIEALLYDIKYSCRQFRRAPLLVIAIVATLAITVGANTLLFAIANAALFRALPHPDSSRLVSMSIAQKGEDTDRMDEPTAQLTIAANLPVFESVATYNSATATLVDGEYPERIAGARISRSFFHVLRASAAIGRTFTDDELHAGGPAAIVLSDAIWTRVFGRRPTIVGERITLDDRSYEIVGVMPPGFNCPGRSEFWLPHIPRVVASGGFSFIDFIGRLQPTASIDQPRAALAALRESRKHELPAAALPYDEIRVMSLHQRLYGDFSRPVTLLLATVACVLLVACANIANLLLAHHARRRGEFALRLAVGASRQRLFRLLLVESLALACMGALPGVGLAFAGLRAFRAFGPPALASLPALAIDHQVLFFTLGLTIATALLFGLAPALGAARADPESGLCAGRIAERDGRWRPRRALVVAEIAVAVVLTVGAALLAKSFIRFQAVERGFHAENVLTASMTLSRLSYPDAMSRQAFFDSLVERLRTLPGVQSVTVSVGLAEMSMTTEWPPANRQRGETYAIAIATGVGDDHFRTFGIPIVEGRECSGSADASGVVINAAFARRAYPGRSPIGEHLDLSTESPSARVVLGVAADVPDIRTKRTPLPTIYACAGQDRAASATVALRARDDTTATALAPLLRTAVRALDPSQPVSRVTTIDQIVRDGMASRWFDAMVIGALAMLALVLALGGLYAVIAYSVAQRTREIGVRAALGADRAAVMTLVLRQGGSLIVAGIGLGVLAAVPLAHFVAAMLFEVQALDAAVFSIVAALVAVVAMFATFVPAHRASRVDPMVALRAE